MKAKVNKSFFSDSDIAAHLSELMLHLLQKQVHSCNTEDTTLLLNTQCTSFLKKFCPVSFDTELLEIEAFLKFFDINDFISASSHRHWPNASLPYGLDKHHRILLRARNLVHQVLGSFDETEFFANCKHSAGSSIGVSYSDTSIEAKSKGMTYTRGVDRWFQYYLSYDPQLRRALDSFGGVYKETRGGKATTVPKDTKKVRMICVEPTLNMFFQQGLMQCLATRLDRVGLSFESQQDRNRYLAWYASLTGSHATIDWSSASDTVSYDLVSFLFPRDWFAHICAFRSNEIEIAGNWEPLHMISTMGNACTFPIETLVFWAIATACCSIEDGLSSTFVDPAYLDAVSVFGDDCVVPAQHSQLFVSTMEKLGFFVNNEKTFLTGDFRESCGGDYLRGKDVRPFYLTGPSGLEKSHLHAWLNIILNRLTNRFIRIYGPLKYIYEAHAVYDYLFSLFRKYEVPIYLVPTHYPDDAGVKIAFDYSRFRRNFSIRRLTREVVVDKHGSRYFEYLTAAYPVKRATCPDLRYWLAIKGLTKLNPSRYSVRRRLSYVVARGTTPWFSIS